VPGWVVILTLPTIRSIGAFSRATKSAEAVFVIVSSFFPFAAIKSVTSSTSR